MKNKKRSCLVLLFLLACLFCMGRAFGEAEKEAVNINKKAKISVSAHKKDKGHLYDGNVKETWEDGGRGWVQFDLPEDTPCYGIYVQWDTRVDFAIQVMDEKGKWQDSISLHADYYNQYIPLEGLCSFRIQSHAESRKKLMIIREVTLLSEGRVPDWVQQWKPFEGKADLLFIATHPDDELIFFGGGIPTYAMTTPWRVQVAYITSVSA